MTKAHYIIFHPDDQRQKVEVSATAMVSNTIIKNWVGRIHVDKIGEGNEDPFVFSNPWLYSYCHASQLRRNPRSDGYLQVDSKLIFVSGQMANRGVIAIDTVFLIGEIHKWKRPVLQLPPKFTEHYQNSHSGLWKRHFRFPFLGREHHPGVSHSYEAKLWQNGQNDFSYLPLDGSREKVSFQLSKLPNELQKKIRKKIKGKYPVLLTDNELSILISLIDSKTEIKVLRDITTDFFIASKVKKC